MKKVILAFDSFKGSVSAKEISDALKSTILQVQPECEVISFPIADGGEGTTEILSDHLNAHKESCLVHDPLMRIITSTYAITKDGRTAIMEMAAAAGLPLLAPEERNPLNTTTFGVGEMIKDALQKGCRHILLGIGGSATNDAGTGMMNALGVRFFNSDKEEIKPTGELLSHIDYIDTSNLISELKDTLFTIISDVNNPFCGPMGAAYVFAPQKGANKKQVKLLDKGLHHYGELILNKFGKDIFNVPGAGAAGGMGGGLIPYLNIEMRQGSKAILQILNFKETLKDASLIFTGEGKIDGQTAMGKALQGIVELAKEAGIPVIALGGSIEETEQLNNLGFTSVFSIQSGPVALQDAMKKETALNNLSRTAIQIIRVADAFSK